MQNKNKKRVICGENLRAMSHVVSFCVSLCTGGKSTRGEKEWSRDSQTAGNMILLATITVVSIATQSKHSVWWKFISMVVKRVLLETLCLSSSSHFLINWITLFCSCLMSQQTKPLLTRYWRKLISRFADHITPSYPACVSVCSWF